MNDIWWIVDLFRHSNVLIGNCLLSIPRDQKTLLNGGVEVYFGHFQSLRLGWGPFLNVNCTQRAFYESGKVHVVMARIFGTKVGETPRHWDLTTFKKMITNLKVKSSFFKWSQLNLLIRY